MSEESMTPPMSPNETWLKENANSVIELSYPSGGTYRVVIDDISSDE